MTNPPPITLPPKVFDILDASVSTYGLGAGRYYRFSPELSVPIPCDFTGHLEHCFGDGKDLARRFGVTTKMVDKAVYAINRRKRAMPGSRVSWTEFVAETGIARGESCDLSTHDSSVRCEQPTPFDVSRDVGRTVQGTA
jgi:hypothetical protein